MPLGQSVTVTRAHWAAPFNISIAHTFTFTRKALGKFFLYASASAIFPIKALTRTPILISQTHLISILGVHGSQTSLAFNVVHAHSIRIVKNASKLLFVIVPLGANNIFQQTFQIVQTQVLKTFKTVQLARAIATPQIISISISPRFRNLLFLLLSAETVAATRQRSRTVSVISPLSTILSRPLVNKLLNVTVGAGSQLITVSSFSADFNSDFGGGNDTLTTAAGDPLVAQIGSLALTLIKAVSKAGPLGALFQLTSAQSLAVVKRAAHVIPTIASASSTSLIKGRSRLVSVASAQTVAAVQRSITKLIRIVSAQLVVAVKPLAKVFSISSAELVTLLFPQGRLQNLVFPIVSAHTFTTQFLATHFLQLGPLSSPQLIAAVKVISRPPIGFSNFLGPTATSPIFTAPAFTTSQSVALKSVRQIIPSSQITAGSGNQIQMTLTNSTSFPTRIAALWLGERATTGQDYDFDGNQVQVTFGGSGAITLPPSGGSITSDFIPFAPVAGTPIIMAVDCSNSPSFLDARTGTVDPGFRYYSASYPGFPIAGNTIGPAGMTQVGSTMLGIRTIVGRKVNVTVLKAITKPAISFAEAVSTAFSKSPPGRIFNLTEAQTLSLIKSKLLSPLISITQVQVGSLVRAIGQFLPFGPAFLQPSGFTTSAVSTINQVARQVIPVDQLFAANVPLQVTFSNTLGGSPLNIVAAYIGQQGATDAAFDGTQVPLAVNGSASFTVRPGSFLLTDPVSYPVTQLVPLIVSFEIASGTSSFDQTPSVESGFHFWIGGPSGSAGTTPQPPPPLALQPNTLAAIAQIGAPALVSVHSGLGKTPVLLSPQTVSRLNTAGRNVFIGSSHQLRIATIETRKFLLIIHESLIIVVRTFTSRLISFVTVESLPIIRQWAPLKSFTSAQSVTKSFNRGRAAIMATALTTTALKIAGKPIAYAQTMVVTVPQFANSFAKLFTMTSAQSVAVARAATKTVATIISASALVFSRALGRSVTATSAQSATVIKQMGNLRALTLNQTLRLVRALPKPITIATSHALSVLRSAPAKAGIFLISQAQIVTMTISRRALSVLIGITQDQMWDPETLITTARKFYRYVKGQRGSRGISKGAPD